MDKSSRGQKTPLSRPLAYSSQLFHRVFYQMVILKKKLHIPTHILSFHQIFRRIYCYSLCIAASFDWCYIIKLCNFSWNESKFFIALSLLTKQCPKNKLRYQMQAVYHVTLTENSIWSRVDDTLFIRVITLFGVIHA